MENAKQELLKALKDTAKIKCVSIQLNKFRDDASQKTLKINHTAKELEDFLSSLDFNYDGGYGGQELYGSVWLEDGTWLSRAEYDGSEWWEHNVLPEIPVECLS